jgi:hypothetical protein
VAVQSWAERVNGYYCLLATDQYPPFEFDRPVNAGLVVGMILLGGACFAGIVVLYTIAVIAAVMSSYPAGSNF